MATPTTRHCSSPGQRGILLGLQLMICLSCIAPAHAAYEERLPGAVAKALKNADIPLKAVSVVVQEVDAVQARVSLNANQPFNPASLMKLLTTFAALELLGPAHTWKTEVWSNGTLHNEALNGDLVLKGGGDPKLTHEQFWRLLRQLRAAGVREIRGNLLLDRSLFVIPAANALDTPPFDNQPLRPYNVEPDALLLNFKTLHLRLQADSATQTVRTSSDVLPANLDIINRIQPTSGACGEWKDGLQAETNPRNGRIELLLTGNYPLSCNEKLWNLAVLNHPQYIEGIFRQLWAELGGTLKGEVRDGSMSPDARLLASLDSPTLAEIIRDINKYSNNVMARQLFLSLGEPQSRPQPPLKPSADMAQTGIRNWLAAKQLHFPELVLENGSGLSRHERIAAENLAHLLAIAWKTPLMPEFIASLPLSAVDGTMKKRLKQNSVAGQAHIKTGSLEGVKGIAGYVRDRRGKWQIVVFMVNHPRAQAAQEAQDTLLQWIYERGN